MSGVCYTRTLTSTKYATTTIRVTNYRNVLTTLRPTGTRTVGQVVTTRVPYVDAYPSYVTHKTTYHTTACTGSSLPDDSTDFPSGIQVPTSLIVIAVVTGLWAIAELLAMIYVLCFSRTAKRERRRKRQGAFNQKIQNDQPQEYTAVSQEPLYSQSESHYAPSSSYSPYGGMAQSSDGTPQTSYVGTNQFLMPQPGIPSALGYGTSTPNLRNPAVGETISHSNNPTTPSPPPGPVSDPHRLLYTHQNDRLSAAVSLVHPSGPQPQSEEQRPLSTVYSIPGPSFGPLPVQPSHLMSSQAHVPGRYRGYAEPSTSSDYNGRF